MKKYYSLQKLLALLALFFISMESKAQFVTIPDPVFVSYLQTNFPSAMSGNQMDTTSLSIIQYGGTMDVHGMGISNLYGIEYFPNLNDLRCQTNQISFLPPLPKTMQTLYCGANNLSFIGAFPDSLRTLICDSNQLTSLPALPSKLGYLICATNQLTSLPQLPTQLGFLNALNNQITCLPLLPNNLTGLLVAGNPVTCLPNIPTAVGFNSDIGTTLCNGMQSTFNGQPVSCAGVCDGDLVVISSAGVALDYVWSNGVQDLNNSSGASAISSICAGNYAVTVTPTAGGCSTYLSTSVNQPAPQQLGQPNINPMNCNDDSTWVFYPGNPPFNLQWSTGAISDSVYLPIGTYTVTVLAGGCGVLPATFTVSTTTILVNALSANVSCNGGNDGTITVTANGGTPPYLYVLNSILLPWQTTGVFTNLAAGNYIVHVMDSNFCMGTTNVTIIQPTPITITTSTTDATCGLTDGSITLNVTGGVSPYVFSIDNGITTQSSNVFNNVTSGFYTVSVEDANGCFVYQHIIVSSIGGPVINSLLPTNTSCSNSNDGSITVNVTGGTMPYQYSSDTGLTQSASNVLMSLNAGSYMVAVADAGGCWTTANAVITSPAAISIFTLINNNVSCNGGNDGSLTIHASNGVPPYLYSLDGGITFQPDSLFDTLVAGNYTVVVQDANGCTGSTGTTVSEPPPLSFGNILSNILVCNLNPVNICFTVTGGTPAYTYLWSDGSVMNCISALPGVYTITVADANGCSISSSTSVTFTPGWQGASVSNLILPTCGMCDGSAEVIMINTQAASYQWLPGNITTAINSQLCDNGNNTVIVTDTAGCVDTVNFILSCHSVWPGDANNDGQADNTDLLAIGIGYGVMGEVRENATIAWQSEKGFDWMDSLVSGTNYKHIDCNGDGVIADDDTIAIIQNFGLTHPLHPALITSILTDPPLYFDIQIDSTNIDTILQIPIMLGTAAIPADSIYGIAFTVSYDTSLVKADSMTISFNNCWMNSSTGHTIGIGINDPLNGKLYAAVTRTSHTDTSGYGELGRLGVVTVDNISARMSSLRSDTLIFTLSDVTMITHDEQYKTVNIINDTLVLNDNTVSIAEHTEPFALSVYPNPTNRFLFLDYDAQLKTPVITLRSLLNEELTINYKTSNGKAIIDLGTIATGIYLLSVSTEKGIVTRKINIQKP